MAKLIRSVPLVLILMLCLPVFAQQSSDIPVTLIWNENAMMQMPDGSLIERPAFSGASYDEEHNFLPVFNYRLDPNGDKSIKSITLTAAVYQIIAPYEFLDYVNKNEPILQHEALFDRKNLLYNISLLPFRYNASILQYEKLISCTIHVEFDEAPLTPLKSGVKMNSVLAAGTWYKFGVQNTGIHIITYQNLKDAGLNPDNIDPRNIRIYGYGGGMLPENPTLFRYTDLPENSIFVAGQDDGQFNTQDYILFYARSPHSWTFNPLEGRFQHAVNLYSDYSYVFLTVDLGTGKRINTVPSLNLTPNFTSTKFNDYYFHESELYNLIKTGRTWYGEVFDLTTTWQTTLNIPNLDLTSGINFKADVAARSTQGSSFEFYLNNNPVFTLPVASTSGIANSNYAKTATQNANISASSSTLNISVEFNKYIQNAVGWLNYLELNYRRNLIYSGTQMAFRDTESVGENNISQFNISNMQAGVLIWNVTDPVNPLIQSYNLNGGVASFITKTDSLVEFIAYDGSGYYSPVFTEVVFNQDLHGTSKVDMIIISPPVFLDQAERLAEFHRYSGGLSVQVLEPRKIYNEFSSGAQDVTAIRDYMKYLYESAEPGQEPRYLLLFGDGSYDYKDRIADNTNLVPCWQSPLTLNPVDSYTTDDFYGCLDHVPNDLIIDLGIGRLPVFTHDQAVMAVNKIINYGTNSHENMGDWRNDITLIGDDEDSNIHLNDAEELYTIINQENPDINSDKIYLDAYQQYLTSSGQRYPDVNTAISNKIEKGTLIMNYVGHGGEAGWAHEQVLVISQINNWNNPDRLPVFVTATCEFSKYDDPGRISAGEFVFLNENGGAISLFSTTRATFAGSNSNLNKSFYHYTFSGNSDTRMGDIIRQAKAQSGSDTNGKKFILLGDPALKLALPSLDATVTRINGNPVSGVPDTLKALSFVTIEGEIRDHGGNPVNTFNGEINISVYDKPGTYTTLANDPASFTQQFRNQKNTLFKGKTAVSNGTFQISFIVPKDIAFSYGNGKISLYAKSDEMIDAAGSFINFIVGGLSDETQTDHTGPVIRLFMNDENFRSGAVTGSNPSLLAVIEDESGINTVGNGIGHDIVAFLDGNSDAPFILNDFYEGDINSSSKGRVWYPFRGLADGQHTLTLKAWDIYNNSGTATITFIVADNEDIVINSLMNYPNPFNNSTVFSFEHNQAGRVLDIAIDIFDLQGRKVKTIKEKTATEGYRYISDNWTGSGDSGERLQQGMYIFRLTVNAEGKTSVKSEKLVLIN